MRKQFSDKTFSPKSTWKLTGSKGSGIGLKTTNDIAHYKQR